MSRFTFKLFIFSIVPIVILLGSYLYLDPFKVLYHYDDYSGRLSFNRDYVSTQTFLNKYNGKNYNSYIFGSSRTIAYDPASWKKYLDNNALPYLFDASCESVYGIYTKLRYLDSIHAPLNNVLIVMDNDFTFATDHDQPGYLFIKHPLISHNGYWNFHMNFIKAYLHPYFLFSLYTYRITGKYYSFMQNYINKNDIVLDSITNRMVVPVREKELKDNPDLYYSKLIPMFENGNGEVRDSVDMISSAAVTMLEEISSILRKNNTNYKIVISPLYNKIKFSVNDMKRLDSIFSHNIYDFSGANEITNDYRNYYELSHYRLHVGDTILRRIYH